MPNPIPPKIKALLATPEPPELGPGPRAGVQAPEALEKSLDQAVDGSPLPRERLDLVRSLILLWHDHLDAAHQIAQAIDNRDGGFVHGIMHRREPDYGNAKYWFHRVGLHPVFPKIALNAGAWLKVKGCPLPEYISKGAWDPFAFVDACQAASRRASLKTARTPGLDSETEMLREMQRIETESLLEYFLQPEAPGRPA